MTATVAYEVRLRRGAEWRVEGIFDDKIIALAAAHKVEARAGQSPVVVIQEIYDPARNHLKSRSIYRSSSVGLVPVSTPPDGQNHTPRPSLPTVLAVGLAGAAAGLMAIFQR